MNVRFFSSRLAVAAVASLFMALPGSQAQEQALTLSRASVPSDVEKGINEAVRAPGSDLNVIHFWAPWCPNCQAEMKNGGWADFIQKNPTTHFYFVSVWNKGEDGRAALEKFGIGGQTNVTVVADPNPSRDKETKTQQFLGLPLGWIPTTWVFKGGKLYYALNYGEVRFPMLQQMLEDSGADWSHK
jgi:thiol-disulfide isomerase/thioredoxin